jgi:GNAT superfamily N-acetyltransferase
MRVTAKNWHEVKRRVLEIEQASFVPAIQEDEDALTKTAYSPTSICLVAFVADRTLVGYAMGDELERFGDVPGTRADRHYGRRNTIYIASVAVDPTWRGRGIGVEFEREIVTLAHRAGYSRVTAHIRSSAHLANQLTRKAMDTFPNWYDTGARFDYVVLDVARTPARARG